jgi:glycosyltransferase involved in cell wall biosynthesis
MQSEPGRKRHVLVIGNEPVLHTRFRGPLIQELLARGHRVTCAASGENVAVRQTLENWGASYIPVFLDRAGTNPLNEARAMTSFYRLIRRTRPDVFFGYTIKPVTYGLIAARLAGVPRRTGMLSGLGYSFTDGRESSVVGRIAKLLLKRSLAFSDMTLFQNAEDRQTFLDAGLLPDIMRTGVVNGSGVDLEHYAPAPLPPGPMVFLMIARLLRDKGLLEYVEAARIVKRAAPDARFLLAGPLDPNPAGVRQSDVDGWIKEGVVEYLGELSDVRPALARSHVFVLPSYREGTPRTVLEAMGMGRAIVTTDVPGCKETVRHGKNGLLVQVKNAQSLADGMLEIAGDRGRVEAMGAASLAYARERYEARAVARDTADKILG